MLKLRSLTTVVLLLAGGTALLIAPHPVAAQARTPDQPVLIPTAIASAKRIYLRPPTTASLTFKDFQKDLQDWGYFTFVSTPEQAEILWDYDDSPVSITMTDPATRVVLWTADAPVYLNNMNDRNAAARSAAGLVMELKLLVKVPTATP